MSSIQVSSNRWTRKRFGLPLGVCVMACMITGAQAQTATFDPFAPDAIAPQEPTANPTAPKPVAPALPPRITSVPATAPQHQTGMTPPVPTAVPAAPAPTHVTPLPAPILAPAPAQAPASHPVAIQPQAAPLSEMEKVQHLQNALGQTSEQAAATPFEQSILAPTQPVAAPKAAKIVSSTPTPPPAPEPEPALTRPLPKPILKEETAPAAEIDASTPAPTEGNLLDNIGSFFENLFSSNPDSAAEENIPANDTAPASPLVEETQPEPQPAPVPKAKEEAAIEAEAHPDEPSEIVIDPRLPTAVFGLGSDIHLGQSTAKLSKQAQCFTKNRGMVTYCVNPTKWHPPLDRHFDVSTHLYKGQKAIVQFDGDIATRLYALFNSEGFQQVIRYFEEKFGPPTHHFGRTTRTLKQGDVDNPTYVWRKENEVEGLTEVFEIRQIADTRGSLPDLQRGSIRVYYEGARSIFSLSSDLDFMELH